MEYIMFQLNNEIGELEGKLEESKALSQYLANRVTELENYRLKLEAENAALKKRNREWGETWTELLGKKQGLEFQLQDAKNKIAEFIDTESHGEKE